MQFEIFYTPKFDLPRKRKYTTKYSPTSLHHFIRQLPLAENSEVLDLGGGDGSAVSLAHADRGIRTTVIDQCTAIDDRENQRTIQHPHLSHIAADIDGDWTALAGSRRFNTV